MQILKEILCANWQTVFSNDLKKEAIMALEEGQILYFPKLAFKLTESEIKLLSPDIADPKSKNISFNCSTGRLRGVKNQVEHSAILKEMMQRFAKCAEKMIQHILPSYKNALQIGRTSFRPMEIAGRSTSYRKDDTRLHVDAFPATPNHGRRILRLFTNINPYNQARVWRVGDLFSNVANQFTPRISRYSPSKAFLLKTFKITKAYRSEYDHIMLNIHDSMKADLQYQAQSPQQSIEFLSGSSWIVQTDHVSHAAMSGQHVLEQTFYLPVNAMANPNLAPLRILENLLGKTLV